MEQVITRSVLRSNSSSPSISSEPSTFSVLKNFDIFEASNSKTTRLETTTIDETQADDDELDFRLFSAPKAADREIHKVRVRSPSLGPGDAGFVQPNRDPSYYFTQDLPDTFRENFQSVALTGEQIHTFAKQPWPGSAYGWKVLHLPPSALSKEIRRNETEYLPLLVDESTGTTRKRPGKKYRIKLRHKHAAFEARKAAEETAAAEKESALREKRTRLNRAKQIKKRARDKARKAAETTGDGPANTGDNAGEDLAGVEIDAG